MASATAVIHHAELAKELQTIVHHAKMELTFQKTTTSVTHAIQAVRHAMHQENTAAYHAKRKASTFPTVAVLNAVQHARHAMAHIHQTAPHAMMDTILQSKKTFGQ